MHEQTKQRIEQLNQDQAPSATGYAMAALAGAAAGAVAMYFLDPRQGRGRRAQTVDRLGGQMRDVGRVADRARRRAEAEVYAIQQQVKHSGGDASPPENDAVLKHKVESILYRDQQVPKGDMNINAEHGIVVLRGTAQTPEMIKDIENRVLGIDGVLGVRNELHLPNLPDRDWERAATADMSR